MILRGFISSERPDTDEPTTMKPKRRGTSLPPKQDSNLPPLDQGRCSLPSSPGQALINAQTFLDHGQRSVVVAFSLDARILVERPTIHSPPVLFFFFLKWRVGHAH